MKRAIAIVGLFLVTVLVGTCRLNDPCRPRRNCGWRYCNEVGGFHLDPVS